MKKGGNLGVNSSNGLLRHRGVPPRPKIYITQCESSSSLSSSGNQSSSTLLGDKLDNFAGKRIRFSDLPEWQKSNEFIQGNYRPLMFSVRGCFISIFQLHNQTWNIWTHLLGFLFFVALVSGVLAGMFEDLNIYDLPWVEQVLLLSYFVGIMVCFLCSTLFHILHSHSQSVNRFFSRLDYSGIAFLITCSSVPAYYYGFYCTKVAQWIHIAILISLCASCMTVILRRKFDTPEFRVVRFGVFALFGLYGVVPFFHIYMREGYTHASDGYAMWGIITMAATYIGGGSLYALRIPERFWPGKFDVWASSHQLFHLSTIIGAFVHYNALLKMIKYRLSVENCVELLLV